jgi:hypothetical protein
MRIVLDLGHQRPLIAQCPHRAQLLEPMRNFAAAAIVQRPTRRIVAEGGETGKRCLAAMNSSKHSGEDSQASGHHAAEIGPARRASRHLSPPAMFS